MRASLQSIEMRLHAAMQTVLTMKRHQLKQAALRISVAGPVETMKRGYAIVTKQDELLRSAADAEKGDRLYIRFADGKVQTLVESIHVEKDEI